MWIEEWGREIRVRFVKIEVSLLHFIDMCRGYLATSLFFICPRSANRNRPVFLTLLYSLKKSVRSSIYIKAMETWPQRRVYYDISSARLRAPVE